MLSPSSGRSRNKKLHSGCICLEFKVGRLPNRLLPSAETKFSYQCPELSTKRREADKGNKAASTWCIWMFWCSLLSSMSLGVAKHLQFIYIQYSFVGRWEFSAPVPKFASAGTLSTSSRTSHLAEDHGSAFCEILLKTNDLPPSLQGFGHYSGPPNKLSNLIHAFLVSGKSQSTNGRNSCRPA